MHKMIDFQGKKVNQINLNIKFNSTNRAIFMSAIKIDFQKKGIKMKLFFPTLTFSFQLYQSDDFSRLK